MKRFRRKKSDSPANDSEGIQQVYWQQSTPNSASDFTHSSNAMKEYPTASESDRASLKLVTGMRVKNLLAEEMTKETESKRRPPNVVARLMGLDGLPSQQPICRQLRTSQRKIASEVSELMGKPCKRRPYKKNSKDEPEFKDVYEVSEGSKVDKESSVAEEHIKPKHFDAEMAFIQQKFRDAKCLSTDNELYKSKEFFHTLNTLDTNKDLSIKFLELPNPPCTKHLLNLQSASPALHCSKQVVKRLMSERCERDICDLKSKKETSCCNTRNHKEHHDSLSSNSFSSCSSKRSGKPSEIHIGKSHNTKMSQTRIVVLKPNLEKLQNGKQLVSPHIKHVENPSVLTEKTEPLIVKPSPGKARFSRPRKSQSRERANEITGRMSQNLGREPVGLPSIFQGYAADESSYSGSGSDSGAELDESMFSARKSFHHGNQRNVRTPNSLESSISREAKKTLSKRWSFTQRYRNIASVSKSSICDMLAKPDSEIRRDTMNSMLVQDVSTNGVFVDDDIAGLDRPSGFNCWDDRKDQYERSLSRSGSVSASSDNCYNTERSKQCRNKGRISVQSDPIIQERKRAAEENVVRREDSPFRSTRSENRHTQFPYHGVGVGVGTDAVEDNQCNLIHMGIKVGKDTLSEEVSLVSKMLALNDSGPCMITLAELNVGDEITDFSCRSQEKFSAKPSSHILRINNPSAPCPEVSELQIEHSEGDMVPVQLLVPEIECVANSKEAGQPSPISILEGPLAEDISSSSKCFERVGVDLHELRMQLQLLRMESGADGGNLMLSDKDDFQLPSTSEIDGNSVIKDGSWQTSYVFDILQESGFNTTDPGKIVAIWHSFSCPIGPRVFEMLEKKYCLEKSGSRSDRKLLFERINRGLFELFWYLVNPYPWVRMEKGKLRPKCLMKDVQYEVNKWLENEEDYTRDRMLDLEMPWLDFADEIHIIGMELEKKLVYDLIEEMANINAI